MAQKLLRRTTALVIFFLLSLPPGRVLASDGPAVMQRTSVVTPASVDPNDPHSTLLGSEAEKSTKTTLTAAKLKAPREGDTIWLEEKIAPSTRWIENLVKPITVWMENKIQQENPGSKATAMTPGVEPARDRPVVANSKGETATLDTQNNFITAGEASAIAQERITGNILRVKLLEQDNERPRYRVKLISTGGEIHILYVDARSQKLIAPQSLSGQP